MQKSRKTEMRSNPTKEEPPLSGDLRKALQIFEAARITVKSFLATYDQVRKARRAKGTPTDEEQDLLRAMLLFAGAGLDSMVKQAARDALPRILDTDKGAQLQLEDYIRGRLQKPESNFEMGIKSLASALASPSPRGYFVQELIKEITGSSTLSKDQLLRTAAFFGIPSQELCLDLEELGRAFHSRNQIAHEMDIDFQQRNRSRRSRTKNRLEAEANLLLDTGQAFLRAAEKKLSIKR